MSEIFIAEKNFRNRYEYGPSDLLGEGGFAQVYKAYDRQFEEYVALKFYNKGEQGKYDVLHEMKDSRKYTHPNIIQVHDAFVVRFDHTGGHSDVQVGVLEFADGGNLRDFVNSSPGEEEFREVLRGILKGLEYLHHTKNIIHRDLSPENILMHTEDNKRIPKIADFGISKKINYLNSEQDEKKSTQLLGKVDYMAPEQFYPEKFGIQGQLNTNVDLWAFGVILYELFTHRKPFGENTDENPMLTIQSITNDTVEGLNEIPDPYRSIIRNCLQKKAMNRAKSAGDLITLLEQKPAMPDKGYGKTVPLKEFKTKLRSRKLVFPGIIAGIAAIGISAFLMFNGPKTKRNSPLRPDPVVVKNDIQLLIRQKEYNRALFEINQLPEDMRANQQFISLRNETLRLKQSDSILMAGDRFFTDKNYKAALSAYNLLKNEYRVTDAGLQKKIENTQALINAQTRIYRNCRVTSKPDPSIIRLQRVEVTEKYTIISLLIIASNSTYTIYQPGTRNAFRLEYGDKKTTLPLLSVKGMKIGDTQGLKENTVMKLFFASIPEYVREITLLEGQEHPEKDLQYWDFEGIELR
jgi:serine/threonine protein kinase